MNARHPDAPTLVMIDCLESLQNLGRPLVVDEQSGRLAAVLRARGDAPGIWQRQLAPDADTPSTSWPTGEGYDAALIRLSKSKEALDLALHAAASKVRSGGIIAVFGANAEGVRSVEGRLRLVADDVTTLATRQHARVLAGRRKAVIDGLNGRLSDWKRMGRIAIAGIERSWISYPGTFAKGGLDEGTAFLLGHLPKARPGSRILDFAAGTGVVAAALSAGANDLEIDLIEADALALAAASENVPGGRAIAGASLAAVGDRRYDLIVSNPPIHDGIAEDRRVLNGLIADAPRHLLPGGRLLLVVQRRVAVMPLMSGTFAEARIVAQDGRFTVAMGEQPLLGRSLPLGRDAFEARPAPPHVSKRRSGPRNDNAR